MKRKKHLSSLNLIVSSQFVSCIGYSALSWTLGRQVPGACAVRHFVTSSVMFTFVICYSRFYSLIFIEKPHVWPLRLYSLGTTIVLVSNEKNHDWIDAGMPKILRFKTAPSKPSFFFKFWLKLCQMQLFKAILQKVPQGSSAVVSFKM